MKKAIIFLSVTTSQNQSIQNCIDYFKRSDSKNTDFLIVSNAGHIPNGITDSNQLQLTKVTNWGEGLIQILLRQYSRKLNPFLKSMPEYEEIEI